MIKKIREYIRKIIIEAYDPDDVHELGDEDDLLIEPDVKEDREKEKGPYDDVYDEEVDEANVVAGGAVAGVVGPAFDPDPERKY